MIPGLLRPVGRTLPRRALAAAAVLGLLLAAATRLVSGRSGEWLCLNLLRSAALAFGLGLAFLLDDPARHTTAAVPTGRPVRVAIRVALVAPLAALWWTVVLLLAPERIRPPVGALTLEAAAIAVCALAAAAIAVRRTDETEPGTAAAAALLGAGIVVRLWHTEHFSLLVAVGDPAWDASHARWAAVLAVAALVCAYCVKEPLMRTRGATRRGGNSASRGGDTASGGGGVVEAPCGT
ncbi:ABC transporter [Streptomyces sp. NPDC008313]|uniref:ABC transporter n=1 Tax=Streptomyces sp. NPDC008313 TaxID=3364826 RepID=UPI0036EFD6F9